MYHHTWFCVVLAPAQGPAHAGQAVYCSPNSSLLCSKTLSFLLVLKYVEDGHPPVTWLRTNIPGVWVEKVLKSVLFISKDNFLRGDNSRKVQHQQQRKPRKKTKPPALTKKHKKKRRRGPRRPQKPIPPAVPQGNLSMPTSVSLPVEASQMR